MPPPFLCLQDFGPRGRGVSTRQALKAGSLVEVCPVLVLSPQDTAHIVQTKLYDYYFEWNDDAQSSALALGYGSLYNHSYQANLSYEMDFENQLIRFYAFRDIKAGEELCINYGGNPQAQESIWFEDLS